MSQHPRTRYPIAEDESPSEATYFAVAEAKGCDPLDLPPLAAAISTDGLDDFVRRSTETENLTCSFDYAGCSVMVSDEEIRVHVR